MANENEIKTEGTEGMGEKLKKAGKKAEAQKAARRERTVKGSHLLPQLLSSDRIGALTTEDKSGFTKIVGKQKGRAIYVAKKGGRVDLSGFTVEAEAVTTISEEDARQKHLGKVRGQLDFNKADDAVLAAYDAALAVLAEEPAASEPESK
ncbi:MAG: hypothetical protein JO270_00165 [Acidobacteriaceae bacterium]|nr:hypothetical protein [Acidobacteriaceae bacterium]